MILSLIILGIISRLPVQNYAAHSRISQYLFNYSDQQTTATTSEYQDIPHGSYAGGDEFIEDSNNFIASSTIKTDLENRSYKLMDCCDKDSNSFPIIVAIKNGRGTHSYTRTPYEDDVGEYEKYFLTNSVSGDLNDDGHDDIALIIERNYAVGNGVEPLLFVLLNEKGSFTQISEVELEERAVLNSINIERGQVILDMTIHDSKDGACCASIHKIFKFALSDLIKMNDTMLKNPFGWPESLWIN